MSVQQIHTQYCDELNILIVEDNQVNQMIISHFLAPLNCKFDITDNGLEAVVAVTQKKYDLVLMDVQMPEMDGIAATKHIRSLAGSKGQMPIIAVTANTLEDDRQKCLLAGMNDFIPKPVDQQDLLDAITRCVGKANPEIDKGP